MMSSESTEATEAPPSLRNIEKYIQELEDVAFQNENELVPNVSIPSTYNCYDGDNDTAPLESLHVGVSISTDEKTSIAVPEVVNATLQAQSVVSAVTFPTVELATHTSAGGGLETTREENDNSDKSAIKRSYGHHLTGRARLPCVMLVVALVVVFLGLAVGLAVTQSRSSQSTAGVGDVSSSTTTQPFTSSISTSTITTTIESTRPTTTRETTTILSSTQPLTTTLPPTTSTSTVPPTDPPVTTSSPSTTTSSTSSSTTITTSTEPPTDPPVTTTSPATTITTSTLRPTKPPTTTSTSTSTTSILRPTEPTTTETTTSRGPTSSQPPQDDSTRVERAEMVLSGAASPLDDDARDSWFNVTGTFLVNQVMQFIREETGGVIRVNAIIGLSSQPIETNDNQGLLIVFYVEFDIESELKSHNVDEYVLEAFRENKDEYIQALQDSDSSFQDVYDVKVSV